jgi:hypothetical protein
MRAIFRRCAVHHVASTWHGQINARVTDIALTVVPMGRLHDHSARADSIGALRQLVRPTPPMATLPGHRRTTPPIPEADVRRAVCWRLSAPVERSGRGYIQSTAEHSVLYLIHFSEATEPRRPGRDLHGRLGSSLAAVADRIHVFRALPREQRCLQVRPARVTHFPEHCTIGACQARARP